MNATYLPTAFTSDPNTAIHYGSLGPGDTPTLHPTKPLPTEPTEVQGGEEEYQEIEAREDMYHVLGEVGEEDSQGDDGEAMYEVPTDVRNEEDPEMAAVDEREVDLTYSTLQYK